MRADTGGLGAAAHRPGVLGESQASPGCGGWRTAAREGRNAVTLRDSYSTGEAQEGLSLTRNL